MEAIHPIRVAIPTRLRQSTNQLQPRRFSVPRFVSRAHSDKTPASPIHEDQVPPPLVESADWREFRAKLVARERAETAPKKPQAITADPYALPLGEARWAHAIPEPEKGCLLIATEKLDGNHMYKRTVILLLSVGSNGTTGIILNRPSFMSPKGMKLWSSNVPPALSETPLFFGGPLFEGLFLANTCEEEGGERAGGFFDEIVKGVCYGSAESLRDMDLRGSGEFRFFDGYCSWEGEELRDAIRAGYWAVAACSPNLVGLSGGSSVGLWDEINGLIGHRKVC